MPRKNGRGSEPEDGDSFGDIRKILRETAAEQRKFRRQHEEFQIEHEKRMAEHEERMAEHEQRMAEHEVLLIHHEKRMAEHDERMDRVGRHLEVLVAVTDDLIRGKADRKRR